MESKRNQVVKYAQGKVSNVFIEHGYVTKIFGMRKKTLKPIRGTYKDCWGREVECLQRLKGKPHFPDLVEVMPDIMGLRMENLGESLYTSWHVYDMERYIDQIHRICDTLEECNIKYFYAHLNPLAKSKTTADFPLSNLCIHDDELYLLDFEACVPVGSEYEQRLHPRYAELMSNYNPDEFREFMLTGILNPKESYGHELWRKLAISDRDKKQIAWEKLMRKDPREVYATMKQFSQPSDNIVKQWKKYQKRYGMGDAQSRVERMQLSKVIDETKTVVDIGCNDGYISMLVAPMAKTVTGVEPHVELPVDKPSNVSWVKEYFNDFTKQGKKFDVLMSLAVSIQLRDFGGLTEQEIVDAYYEMLEPGGVVVHETQKLEARPNNQDHTNKMLAAFKTKFTQVAHGQARPSGKREYYHFRKDA